MGLDTVVDDARFLVNKIIIKSINIIHSAYDCGVGNSPYRALDKFLDASNLINYRTFHPVGLIEPEDQCNKHHSIYGLAELMAGQFFLWAGVPQIGIPFAVHGLGGIIYGAVEAYHEGGGGDSCCYTCTRG